jgi:hypothetical protein
LEQHPHLVEYDKPKKLESVGQTLPQLPWKQKRGDKKKFGFLSSNFMKLCRNTHHSVWQLLGGFEKFKMVAIAMVTKVQKNVKFTPNFTKFCSNVSRHIHI